MNGTTASYVLEGSKVVFETDGSSKIWYYYNASGAPVAFRIGSVLYIFRKNLQGDITGIYSREGNLLVSYSYDAWGAKSSKRRLRRMKRDDFGDTVRKIDQ